ncbi:hypothetical protein GWN63_06070, partial [Candidatus Bathyarchaeota archaeon]|nr:hypothetical protein [Candidatus Bathyarchaeota archaeon]NIU81787.1 hypothetical protein [Candidatus Bathyarchaeota archaeon]NIV68426.1 hypothetical protein [Candidatus Bathyarchaeota archaeon]NIW16725.1 hypothetical protein [Candidatus Bathyarchaeota archaeon]NIW34925.1 hypothetical protein [Candidatus Bathyarchaeota archaeon]
MKKEIFAVLLLMTLTLAVPSLAGAETPTWVMIQGQITDYGGTPVAYGYCGAHAKIGDFAKVHAFWIPTIPTIPSGEPTTENFTYSFYMAKMDNGTAEMPEGMDLYMEGLWDVFNVTFGYYGEIQNSTTDPMALEVYGNMTVYNNWTDFTINIEGFETLSGTVLFKVIKDIEIPMGDVAGPPDGVPPEVPEPDCEVNIHDLVAVAQAYDSTPGLP